MKKFLLFLTCFTFFLFAENSNEFLSQSTSQQVQSNSDQFESAFKRMLWVLAGLVALIIATVWMIRRLMNIRLSQTNNLSSIKILEKRNLSPKSVLYIVEVDEKRVLLAESQIELRKLTTLETLDQESDS